MIDEDELPEPEPCGLEPAPSNPKDPQPGQPLPPPGEDSGPAIDENV